VRLLPPLEGSWVRAPMLNCPVKGRATENMKILYLSPEYAGETVTGGLGTYTANISRGMALLGHDVHVLVCAPRLTRRDSRDDGVELHFRPVPMLPWPRPLPNFWATRSRLATALAFLREYRKLGMNFDVVQASEYMAPALFLARSVPSLIVRVSAPASLILECDGLPLGTDNAWAAQLERRAIRQARTIVSPSRFMERSLRDRGWLDGRTVTIAPSPVDVDAWSGPLRAAETAPTVLAVGRMDQAKGLDVLVEAAGMLLPVVPDLQLVLVGRSSGRNTGPAYEDLLAEKAKMLGVSCTFAGERRRSELLHYYTEARVVVMANRFDNMSNVGLEALAAGRPLVCTTSSGISELVERTDPAAVVPADDAQQLADAMGRYLASPSLAAQMGQRGQELVRAELSLSVTSRKMEALYNEIVAKPKEVRTG